MKTHALFLRAGLPALVMAAVSWAAEPAQSPVQVSFRDVEKFTDFRQSYMETPKADGFLAEELTKHLAKEARRYLTEGQRLEVTFTDIDLAGDFEPWRGAQFDDIRILKDIHAPRMTFDFRLLGADGKVVAEGHRELVDLGYQMHMVFPTSDGLRYDKQVLTDWLRKEFRRSK